MQADFTGDMFTWKRMGLVEVGGRGWWRHKFRAKQGKDSQKPGWQAHEWPKARWPETQERQAPESFVLKTYIVGGMG